MGARDLARRGDRACDLRELPHHAGRGELAERRRPRRRRAERGQAGRRRDLELVGRSGAGRDGDRAIFRTPRCGDHGVGGRQWLSRLERGTARLRRVPGILARRGRRGRHAPERGSRRRVGGRDGVERVWSRRGRLQHRIRRACMAAGPGRLRLAGVRPRARRCRHLRGRRSVHGLRGARLEPRMRIALRRRRDRTQDAVVHRRRHQPVLAADRLGVRARGRVRRRCLSREDALRKRADRDRFAARRARRLKRRMCARIQRNHGPIALLLRRRGKAQLRPRVDLPRGPGLRRPERRRNAGRPRSVQPERRTSVYGDWRSHRGRPAANDRRRGDGTPRRAARAPLHHRAARRCACRRWR